MNGELAVEFDSIVGHEEIKKQLLNSLNMGTLSHAHIFCGEDGIGKSIISKQLSISIIGKKDYYRNYVDIVEFRMAKGKQSIGISDVLNVINEMNKKPFEGDKKVIIMFNSDKMTSEAQNAFLKTIEEPPKGVYIILLVESLEDVLDTIKSRCQIHKLRRLKHEEIQEFINTKLGSVDSEIKEDLCAFSDGIPGRINRIMQDEDFKNQRNTILDIIIDSRKKNKEEILKYEDFFIKNRLAWKEIFICVIYYIRDIIIYKETSEIKFVINRDKIISIKELAHIFSFTQLSGIIEIVNDTAKNLERNVNVALAIDSMLLSIQEV